MASLQRCRRAQAVPHPATHLRPPHHRAIFVKFLGPLTGRP